MTMRYRKAYKSNIKSNPSYLGESLEDKVRRVIDNQEPIEQISPIIYTERKDGVLPQYDIRTDRFEVAQTAMDQVSRMRITKRMERINGESKTDAPETPSAETK